MTPGGGIREAKTIVARHEELIRAGDVDGIVANVADDVVFLAPSVPLMEGRAEVRRLYEGMLAMGFWDLHHQYGGAESVGNLVVLHGVARGTMTPVGEEGVAIMNDFVITLRRQPEGAKLRFWRLAFAPARAES
ncbi:MAG: nuclear transport factor 2 family protein [Gemmatimonadetes bacterium]|nr:nuclear transport factor 2 family protein [Gemmatimonadota bacterium]